MNIKEFEEAWNNGKHVIKTITIGNSQIYSDDYHFMDNYVYTEIGIKSMGAGWSGVAKLYLDDIKEVK